MQFVRWEPFQRSRASAVPDARFNESSAGWAPPVEIFEKNEALVIRAEIPGVKREDMDVGIENGILTLHGERKQESGVEEANAYRMERVYGTFRRSFTLPTTVDATKVTAVYKDGILEVTVPKLEASKPRGIEIKAA